MGEGMRDDYSPWTALEGRVHTCGRVRVPKAKPVGQRHTGGWRPYLSSTHCDPPSPSSVFVLPDLLHDPVAQRDSACEVVPATSGSKYQPWRDTL